jgi:hypothetical protein
MWAHLVGVFGMVSSSSAFNSGFPKRPHSTRSANPLVKRLFADRSLPPANRPKERLIQPRGTSDQAVSNL